MPREALLMQHGSSGQQGLPVPTGGAGRHCSSSWFKTAQHGHAGAKVAARGMDGPRLLREEPLLRAARRVLRLSHSQAGPHPPCLQGGHQVPAADAGASSQQEHAGSGAGCACGTHTPTPPCYAQRHGYIGEFELVDDHRAGKIVVELNGRLNKCGCISPRYDIGHSQIEDWVARLLPSRQFGLIVLTTSQGIMDHEEARRKKVGGKVLGFFY
jgi:hypothetical protein